MRWPKKTAEKRKLRYSRTRAAQYRCWIRTDVALADLLRDLDVRTVDGADEQAAVQAELHVRRARRLRARRGDVLADVPGRCRNKHLGKGDGVVGEEVELEVVFGVLVGIDHASGVDNETNGLLRDVV